MKNLLLQNDVIALIDDAGETVVEYKYNSWGKILSITGSKAGTIGKSTRSVTEATTTMKKPECTI